MTIAACPNGAVPVTNEESDEKKLRPSALSQPAAAAAAPLGLIRSSRARGGAPLRVPLRHAGDASALRAHAVSRQAVHQTVAVACRRGIVELTDDPLDGRARKVSFTAKGMQMVASASRVARSIETGLERQLGPRDLASLRRILAKSW